MSQAKRAHLRLIRAGCICFPLRQLLHLDLDKFKHLQYDRLAEVQVGRGGLMRRFVTFFVLLLVSVPFGISISGCGKKDPVVFCNASSGDGGVVVGQLNNIVLQPVIYGISLNYGQIGQLSTPVGTDCKGTAVSVKAYTYGSRDVSIVDINPATGALCAGTWNRNLNVIPDFTVCTAPVSPNANNSVTYLTAEANGVTSNPIPV
jgi:hypothetical protein